MSNLNWRSSPKTALIAAGWLALVIGAVRFGDRALESWSRGAEELEGVRSRLGRLHGWLAVEQEVSDLETRALGPLARLDPSEVAWKGVEGLQGLAQSYGLSVKDLRPSETAAQGPRPASLLWDIQLEGPIESMGRFLREIPDRIPGIRLESLQLLPQEKTGAQALIRLNLPVWERRA